MKHSFKHNLSLGLLVAAGALTFSACSDDIATDVIPSTIDPKQWNLDANMDTIVKPGDDFARYCWGKWYDAQGEVRGDSSLGTIAEAYAEVEKKLDNLDAKELKQMASELSNLGEDDAGMEQLRQNIQDLLELRLYGNEKEIAKELGKFLASGKRSSMCLTVEGFGDQCYYYIRRDANQDYVSDIAKNLNDGEASKWICGIWLEKLGMNREYITEVLKGGLSNQFYNVDAQNDEIGKAFCQGLGIDENKLYNSGGYGSFIYANARHIIDMMICHEAADILLVSQSAYKHYLEFCQLSEDDFVKRSIRPMLRYPLSKEFCEKYCTEGMRSTVLKMMEDLRTTFASRIDQLTWMSSTTKQNAKEKLAAMKFHAICPDNWISEGFPELKGNSLYEDVQILRQTDAKLKNEFLSHNAREDMMNCNIINDSPTYTVNCFYDPYINAAIIFAPFMMSPFYSSENSDATLYAIGTVLGHEITHGFDNTGSKYGPYGEDKNWWTVSDKQEYDERTQLLVDCYNHLPGYMDCSGSTFTDGTLTLGENIADLGGLEIALQAYTEKLEKQGYYGDELEKQQKRFFQAYANIWRSKYSIDANEENLKTDVHANGYTRILGATMNCNRWYELYGVQWGDKNYLKPEKRTHIW